MFKSGWSKVLCGFVLGTAGVPLLKTKTAKKVFTYVTAGAFIVKDRVLEVAEDVQGQAMNISDDAKDIVEKYYENKDAEFAETVEGENTDGNFKEVETEE